MYDGIFPPGQLILVKCSTKNILVHLIHQIVDGAFLASLRSLFPLMFVTWTLAMNYNGQTLNLSW